MSESPDWAIRIAEDPQGSLERLAQRRGMTKEELEARYQLIQSLSPQQLDDILFEAGIDLTKLTIR